MKPKTYRIKDHFNDIINDGVASIRSLTDVPIREKKKKKCSECNSEFIPSPHNSLSKCLPCFDAPHVAFEDRQMQRALRKQKEKERRREQGMRKELEKHRDAAVPMPSDYEIWRLNGMPLDIAFFDTPPPFNQPSQSSSFAQIQEDMEENWEEGICTKHLKRLKLHHIKHRALPEDSCYPCLIEAGLLSEFCICEKTFSCRNKNTKTFQRFFDKS